MRTIMKIFVMLLAGANNAIWAQQTVSDSGNYGYSASSNYKSGLRQTYNSGLYSSTSNAYAGTGTYSPSVGSAAYQRTGYSSAAKTNTCTYCKVNPCYASSLPYHCTLEQCYDAMNAENEFTIYAPYTITISKCFLAHAGFKLFSYNLCVKDPSLVRPEIETVKKVICTVEQDCFLTNTVLTDPGDGYVYVSRSPTTDCASLLAGLPRTLYCEIKAYDTDTNGQPNQILGYSNPFYVTITEDTNCT